MQEGGGVNPPTDENPTRSNVGENAQTDTGREGSDIKEKIDDATEKARDAADKLLRKDQS